MYNGDNEKELLRVQPIFSQQMTKVIQNKSQVSKKNITDHEVYGVEEQSGKLKRKY